MNLDHIRKGLEKRREQNGAAAFIEIPATNSEILEAERSLGTNFPDQVKYFYLAFNGIYIPAPHIEIFPVGKLHFTVDGLIHFCTVAKEHKLCLNASKLNEAQQWDIVNLEDGYRVTRTMASFWSNKIFAWLDRQRPIWRHFDET